MQQLKFYLTLIILFLSISFQQLIAEGFGTEKASIRDISMMSDGTTEKDYTKDPAFTGDVSFPLSLVTIGGVDAQLQYNSNIYKKVRSDNQVSPSGWVGFGWSLDIGTIVGDIGNTSCLVDDHYYYVDKDGSSEIIQSEDGIFRLQDYKAWKITRKLDTREYILGWEIIKEDGTILRFGNYDKDSSKYFLSRSEPTSATRCMLGYRGIVENFPSDLYTHDSISLIPYQWDLSDIQDVASNHTTIIYQQERIPLKITINSILYQTTKYYTRESHPYKIKDYAGGEVEFVLGNMNPLEYYGDSTTYNQNLFEKKFLDTLKLKRNGEEYKKIIMKYNPLDILNIGAKKRYLSKILILDKHNKVMPVIKFDYKNGSEWDKNPGALEQVLYPNGGKVKYTYKAQSLHKVTLDTVSWFPSFASFPTHDLSRGIAGKDFIVLCPSNQFSPNYPDPNIGRWRVQPISVFRRESTSWYLDSSFPLDSAFYCKVGYDYVAALTSDDHIKVVKRMKTGWSIYDVDSALALVGGQPNTAHIIGAGSNFFVIQHDAQYSGPADLSTMRVSVVRLTARGIKIDTLEGRYYTTDTYYYWWLNAECGNNYFVLRSCNSEKTYWHLTHFKFISGRWKLFGRDTAQTSPGTTLPRNYIGNNFIVVFNPGHGTKVYRHTGDTLEQIQDYVYYHGLGIDVLSCVTDYYYTIYPAFVFGAAYTNLGYIHSWNGQDFNPEVSLQSIFSEESYRGGYSDVSMQALGRKLVLFRGECWDDSAKVGVTTFSPSTSEWSAGKIIEQRRMTKCESSFSLRLNENSFLIGWARDCADGAIPMYFSLRAYQFIGDSLHLVTADSNYSPYKSNWFCQPGENFIAEAYSYRYVPPYTDSINAFSIGTDSNGKISFIDHPYDFVVDTMTVISGIGDTLVTTYKFEIGAFDESYTIAQYNKVTIIPPGDNGKKVTYYYNDLKQGQAVDFVVAKNFEELDGLPYKTSVYDKDDTEVQQTINNWSAYWVGDTTLGISYQLLDSTKTTQDNVPITKMFKYNSVNLQDSLITELVGVTTNNGTNKDRVTKIKYAFEDDKYKTKFSVDSLHLIAQPYEMEVYEKASGGTTLTLIQKTQTTYSTTTPYLPDSTKVWDGDGNQWINTGRMVSRDSYGNVKEAENVDGVRTTTKWGYGNLVPIATIINAKDSETVVIVCDRFQMSGLGYGLLAEGLHEYNDAEAPAFSKVSRGFNDLCQKVSTPEVEDGCGVLITLQGPDPTVNYIIEFDFLVEQGTLEVRTGNVNYVSQAKYNVDAFKKQWQHAKLKWNLQNNAGNKYVYFRAYLNGGHSDPTKFYLDNIRIYPIDAMCTSQVYDPVTLDVVSTTDENGVTRYIARDGFGRQTAAIK